MSKLLMTLFLTSSLLSVSVFAQAKDYSKEVVKFLKDSIVKNPNIISLDVKVVDKKDLQRPEGWQAYIVSFSGKAKIGKDEKKISQSSIYFVKDGFIATELIDLKTGIKLNDTVSPKFKEEFYSRSNLLYGDENAAHKIALFSDPLCPFCRSFVPGALAYMKKYPQDFAVYYYHYPLEGLHPASPTVCRAAIYLELQGKKDSLLKMYDLKINARETNEQKILDVINDALDTKITRKDIHSIMVENAFNSDQKIANALLVNGTPTVYFDGQKDPTKNKYKSVKVH
ncbi:thioredoxin domain-containing protein [Sulfurimonas sp. HSL-1716]|uniref:thioredoxin domain-containing protein n=1 Tax=Hydrocurvibacter sulfurireducens TaxID=3131937 RepID=UPI0031F95C47